jgi:hypothetical protein
MSKLEKMKTEGFDMATVVMDLEARVEKLEKAAKKESHGKP